MAKRKRYYTKYIDVSNIYNSSIDRFIQIIKDEEKKLTDQGFKGIEILYVDGDDYLGTQDIVIKCYKEYNYGKNS